MKLIGLLNFLLFSLVLQSPSVGHALQCESFVRKQSALDHAFLAELYRLLRVQPSFNFPKISYRQSIVPDKGFQKFNFPSEIRNNRIDPLMDLHLNLKPLNQPSQFPLRRILSVQPYNNQIQTRALLNQFSQILRSGTNLNRRALVPSDLRDHGEVYYYVFDVGTRAIQLIGPDRRVVRALNSLREFQSEFDLESAYFPFIYDTRNPERLILGVGVGTRSSAGGFFEHALRIRNGSHMVLLQAYSRNRGVEGFYGGGVHFRDGQPTLEFQSRGVNRTIDGRLDRATNDFLHDIISGILAEF